jgi:hypothetical protein
LNLCVKPVFRIRGITALQLFTCSLVVKTLCYKPEGRRFETRWCEWMFSIYLILPAALGPGVYSTSKRNEYRKHWKKSCFWGLNRGRCVGLTTLPPSVRRLSRPCGVLNISQPCRPPWPVTGMLYFNYLPWSVNIFVTLALQ